MIGLCIYHMFFLSQLLAEKTNGLCLSGWSTRVAGLRPTPDSQNLMKQGMVNVGIADGSLHLLDIYMGCGHLHMSSSFNSMCFIPRAFSLALIYLMLLKLLIKLYTRHCLMPNLNLPIFIIIMKIFLTFLPNFR